MLGGAILKVLLVALHGRELWLHDHFGLATWAASIIVLLLLSFYSLSTKRAFVRILAEATFNAWSLGAGWLLHFAVFDFSNKEPILGNNKYTLNKKVIELFCLKV